MIKKESVLQEIERLSNLGWRDSSISVHGYHCFGSEKHDFEVSFPEDSWDAEIGNKEGTGPWALFRSELVVKTLTRFNKMLLWEIGAGDGNIAIPLREAGFETICIEPQKQGALALSREGFATYRAFLDHLNLPSNSIEAFGCFDVLEHVEDTNRLLSEIHRTLLPGGLLLVTVPAHQWLFSSFDTSIGHLRRYSIKTLLAELNSFEIEEIRYVFSSLVLPAFFLRRLPYLVYRNRDSRKHRNLAAKEMAVMRKFSSVILRLFRLENALRIPFGLSIYCVARKPLEN